MSNWNSSIVPFIDGCYYFKIIIVLHLNDRLNLTGLMSYIRRCIADKFEMPIDSCFITVIHFFQEHLKSYEAKRKMRLECDCKYNCKLIENNSVSHYKHINEMPSKKLQR